MSALTRIRRGAATTSTMVPFWQSMGNTAAGESGSVGSGSVEPGRLNSHRSLRASSTSRVFGSRSVHGSPVGDVTTGSDTGAEPIVETLGAGVDAGSIVATLGGVTLKRDGQIIGGVGISGGSPQEDQDIADKVLAELGFEAEFAAWAGAKK